MGGHNRLATLIAWHPGGEVEAVPKLFRDERHKRMKQSKRVASYKIEYRQHVGFARGVFTEEGCFAGFNIPIAKFAPEKSVKRRRGVRKPIRGESICNLGDGLVESAQDPTVIAGE